MKDTDTTLTEAEVREIAREEAQSVADVTVDDPETGQQWSVRGIVDRFDLTRREALGAFGLVLTGVGLREAVARVLIGSAEAASTDNLTVPGTLDAGVVDTDDQTINTSVTYPDGTTVTTSPGGIWTEESGSPYTATGSSSANSINPSSLDSFDAYLVFLKSTDNAGSSNNLFWQVDGDTGSNYRELTAGGNRNLGKTEVGEIAANAGNDTTSGWFIMYEERDGTGIQTLAGRRVSTSSIEAGRNTNNSHPPSQFTFGRGADTDWEVRVWGRDI